MICIVCSHLFSNEIHHLALCYCSSWFLHHICHWNLSCLLIWEPNVHES